MRRRATRPLPEEVALGCLDYMRALSRCQARSGLQEEGEKALSFMGDEAPRRLTDICSSEYPVFAVSGRQPMPYKHTNTQCVVRLVAPRGLASTMRVQCQ